MPINPAQNTLCTKRTVGAPKSLISLAQKLHCPNPIYYIYGWGLFAPVQSYSYDPASGSPAWLEAARLGRPDAPCLACDPGSNPTMEIEMFNEFMDRLIDLMTDNRPNVAPAAGQLLQALLGPEGMAEARERIQAEIDRRAEGREEDVEPLEDDVELAVPAA